MRVNLGSARNSNYIKKEKCEMAFECMFCLLNCSGESTTHLVEEVQLIRALQATAATNLLVKTSTNPESGPEREKSATAPLSRFLQGSRHMVCSPESRGGVLRLSYSPLGGGVNFSNFQKKGSPCLDSAVQIYCLQTTRRRRAIVNAVV